jgi:hypothetical protein
MSEIVELHSAPIEDDELIENLARYADGSLSEAQVKARHRLGAEAWLAMGESDDLVRAVEAAKLRRIRSGATKRELAQIEVISGPPILGKIVRDPGSNAKHVIDAVKTLDGLATGGAEAAAAGSRFEITINLGADLNGNPIVEHHSKSIAINPDDVAPDEVDTAGVIAAIATKKAGGDDQGHL